MPAPATPSYHDEFFEAPAGSVLEVAFLWGDYVVSVQGFPVPRDVTIGPHRGADLVVEGVGYGDTNLPLVRYVDRGYSLLVHDAMTLRLHEPGRTWTLPELVQSGFARQRMGGWWELELWTDMRAEVVVSGEVSALVRFSDALVVGAETTTANLDREPLPFVGASGFAHLLFLLLALSMPQGVSSLELDGYAAEDRFVHIGLSAQPEEAPPLQPSWLNEATSAASAAPHAGKEGEAGREEAPAEADGHMAIRGPEANEDLQLKEQRDLAIANNSGVAAELMVASPWGSSDTSVGSDALHALGGLDGAHTGPAKGVFGLGVRNTGRGGAGESEGSIGIGEVTAGTRIGGSCGTGIRGAGCAKQARLGEHGAGVPSPVVSWDPPQLEGSLDPEIIKRVVRQHRRELKACYEAELQKNPALAGEVRVKFTISGTGRVVAALVQDSSLGSAPVETCVTGKIRRWIFPEPHKGGIVVVRYPFRFHS